MESLLIWGATMVLILAIFVPSFIRFRRKRKLGHSRMEETTALGFHRPMSQYPFIDLYRCIGCGSCVDACPEGDVLGIVFGKAMIINGSRCVGHGYCQEACPVMALKVGMGNIEEREDVPVLSKHYETSVRGLYIIGELTGLSLIRNAVRQGVEVIQHLAKTPRPSLPFDGYDVAIVGFGPAGLSASLACIEAGLSAVVLDQQRPGGTLRQYPNRKLVMTQDLELPLYGRIKGGEYSKEFLLDLWEQILHQYPIRLQQNQYVTNIHEAENHFVLTTTNSTYRAARVILALGRRGTPRKLDVPGEELAKVMYQLVDAQSYQNKELLVVGGGDSAVESALGLARQKGNKVTISYRKEKFYRIKKKNQDRIDELIAKKKVVPHFNSEVVSIDQKTATLKVNGNHFSLPNDYVFVHIGGVPPFDFLQEMKIRFGGKKI